MLSIISHRTYCPECNRGSSYTTIGLTQLYCKKHKYYKKNEVWFDLPINKDLPNDQAKVLEILLNKNDK